MSTEKIKYNENLKISKENEINNENIKELNKILPGSSFHKDGLYGGYYLLYKNNKLDMSFIDFDSLKEATSIIAKVKRIHETEFGTKGERPKFYAEGNYLMIDRKYRPDTKYLSPKLTEKFLSKSQIINNTGEYEIQKIANFLNKIMDIK